MSAFSLQKGKSNLFRLEHRGHANGLNSFGLVACAL